MSKKEDLAPVICGYCTYTNYGIYPSGISTPNGWVSCEGSRCDDALETYLDEVVGICPKCGAFVLDCDEHKICICPDCDESSSLEELITIEKYFSEEEE